MENSRDLLKRVSQILRRSQVVHAVTGRAAVQAWRDLIMADAIPVEAIPTDANSAEGTGVISVAGAREVSEVSDVSEDPEIPVTILIAARDIEVAQRALAAAAESQIKLGRTAVDASSTEMEPSVAVADGAEKLVEGEAAVVDGGVDRSFWVEAESGAKLTVRLWTGPTDRQAEACAMVVLTDTVILDDVPVLSVQSLVRDMLIHSPGDRKWLGGLIELGLVDSAAYDWIPAAYVPALTRIFEEVDE